MVQGSALVCFRDIAKQSGIYGGSLWFGVGIGSQPEALADHGPMVSTLPFKRNVHNLTVTISTTSTH